MEADGWSTCRSAVRADDYGTALVRAQAALATSPHAYHLRCFEGLCLTQLSRFEEAAAAYQRALKLSEREAPGLCGLVELAVAAPTAVTDGAASRALRALSALDPALALSLARKSERTLELLGLVAVLDWADRPLADVAHALVPPPDPDSFLGGALSRAAKATRELQLPDDTRLLAEAVAAPPRSSEAPVQPCSPNAASLASALDVAPSYIPSWLALAADHLRGGRAREAANAASRGLSELAALDTRCDCACRAAHDETKPQSARTLLEVLHALALARDGQLVQAAQAASPFLRATRSAAVASAAGASAHAPSELQQLVLRILAEIALSVADLAACQACCDAAAGGGWVAGWADWLRFLRSELNLGDGESQADESTAAQSALEKAMRLPALAASDSARFAYWLARLEWRRGLRADGTADAACQAWASRAAEIAPEWAPPRELLGLLSAYAGRPDAEAEGHLSAAVSLDPTRAAAGAALATILSGREGSHGTAGDTRVAEVCAAAAASAPVGRASWAQVLLGCHALQRANEQGVVLREAMTHFLGALRSADDAPGGGVYADSLGCAILATEGLSVAYERQGRVHAAANCLRDRLGMLVPPPQPLTASSPMLFSPFIEPPLASPGVSWAGASAALLAGGAPLGSLQAVPVAVALTRPGYAQAAGDVAKGRHECDLHCRLASLLERVADAADDEEARHAGSSAGDGTAGEVAADAAAEAATHYAAALRLCSTHAPALVGASRLSLRSADGALASGLIGLGAVELSAAAAHLRRTLSLPPQPDAQVARRLLVRVLTAAAALTPAGQQDVVIAAGDGSDEPIAPWLAVVRRRAARAAVNADPTDREAWRLLAADLVHTACAGIEVSEMLEKENVSADGGVGGVGVDAKSARSILHWLLREPLNDTAAEQGATWTLLGEDAACLGEVGLAQHAFARASRLNPRSVEPWVAYGQLCLTREDTALAEQSFARALQLAPRRAHGAWLGLARCHMLKHAKGEGGSPVTGAAVHEASLAMLAQSLEQRVTVEGLAALAMAASRAGKAHLACCASSMLVARAPDRPDGHAILADQLVRWEQYERAEAALRVAIRLLERTPTQSSASGTPLNLESQLGEARLSLVRVLLWRGTFEDARSALAELDDQLATKATRSAQPSQVEIPPVRQLSSGRGFGKRPVPMVANTIADRAARLRVACESGGAEMEAEAMHSTTIEDIDRKTAAEAIDALWEAAAAGKANESIRRRALAAIAHQQPHKLQPERLLAALRSEPLNRASVRALRKEIGV